MEFDLESCSLARRLNASTSPVVDFENISWKTKSDIFATNTRLDDDTRRYFSGSLFKTLVSSINVIELMFVSKACFKIALSKISKINTSLVELTAYYESEIEAT